MKSPHQLKKMSSAKLLRQIKKNPERIGQIKKQTYELALEAVSSTVFCDDVLPLIDPSLLAEHPDLYTVAMKNRPWELKHVPEKYRTREMILDAFSRYGGSINLFDSPDEEMYAKAVEGSFPLERVPKNMQTPAVYNGFVLSNPDALGKLKKQTPELCLAAVKKYGTYALRHVHEQTAELCRVAVESSQVNGFVLYISYIKPEFMTPEMYVLSVKNGGSLKEVPLELRTYELCLLAVAQDHYLSNELNYVPEEMKTPELYLAYVKSKGMDIRHVPKKVLRKHPEILIAALTNNPFALEFVPKECQTPETCMAAINADPRTFVYVHQLTPELLMAMATHPKYHLVVEQMTHCCEDVVDEIEREDLRAHGEYYEEEEEEDSSADEEEEEE